MIDPAREVRQPEPQKRRRTTAFARRANLPTSGELRGRITIVQEDRFRMEDALGRGYLLILGRKSGVSERDLRDLHAGRTEVVVQYQGAPDLGAVAERVRPA